MTASVSELSSSSDEDLGGSELECSSLSVLAEDELSPYFCPWTSWKEFCPSVSFLLKQLRMHLLKGMIDSC